MSECVPPKPEKPEKLEASPVNGDAQLPAADITMFGGALDGSEACLELAWRIFMDRNPEPATPLTGVEQ